MTSVNAVPDGKGLLLRAFQLLVGLSVFAQTAVITSNGYIYGFESGAKSFALYCCIYVATISFALAIFSGAKSRNALSALGCLLILAPFIDVWWFTFGAIRDGAFTFSGMVSSPRFWIITGYEVTVLATAWHSGRAAIHTHLASELIQSIRD